MKTFLNMNDLNLGLVLSNFNKCSQSENEKTFDFDLPGRCFNVRVISGVLSQLNMFLIFLLTLSLNDEKMI